MVSSIKTDKQQIAQCFSKAASHYDHHASLLFGCAVGHQGARAVGCAVHYAARTVYHDLPTGFLLLTVPVL